MKASVKHHKIMQMQHCLAEAMRKQERLLLAKSACCALYQDGSGKRMVMRYSAADLKGHNYKGIIGVANHVKFGIGSSGIEKTTKELLIRFCTEFAHTPFPNKIKQPPEPKFHATMVKHIRFMTEIFGTDAAADELKVARSMGPLSKDSLVDGLQAFFPNQKAVVRDFTHAARRIAASNVCM